jgi:diacylglycerol kinase (ATP)
MSGDRKTTLLQSFNHAFQGVVDGVRRDRNMRIHFAVALVVLVASLFLNLTRLELLAVIVAISFVIMAELFNTAIEAVVDLLTDEYSQRAKAAKDLAAGGVLIAAANALVVAYLVLADRLSYFSLDLLLAIRRSPTHLTIVAFGVVVVLVIVVKATRRKGTPLSGGLPSGHAALAFAGWTAVTFLVGGTSEGLLVSAIVFIVAVLVAQSRLETRIHSLLEVLLGAMLGMVATTLIFQFLWF